MSTFPVYTGTWQDYSRGSGVLGQVATLDVKWGGYLIAALSTFVGLVGTSLWTIVAFSIHQCRAKPGKADLLFLQQQAVYRNQGSSFTAASDLFRLCWSWRKRKNKPARVQHLKSRSTWWLLPPMIIFVGFTAAGLFIANVAGATYQSNDVKIALNRCGFWGYDVSTIAGAAAQHLKQSNDTLAGRAYAKNCYDANTALGGCGVYPVQSLPIHTSTVPCPFGNDPTGHNLCLFGNNEAIQYDTGLLDSSTMLGINARKQDRLLARKVVTCSPIYLENYRKLVQDGVDNNIELYYLGPIPSVGTNYTWDYHVAAAEDLIPYQIQPIFAGPGQLHPVPALQVPAGDVSIFFLAQNTVRYVQPVDDILFAAHQRYAAPGGGITYLYKADQFITALGCVEKQQICDPNTSPLQCTIAGSVDQVIDGFTELVTANRLNVQQGAIGIRIYSAFNLIQIYTIVNSLSAAALLAQEQLHVLISTGLPSNQWQIEVKGWAATSLAKFQYYILEFAANVADLGPGGTVEIPDSITASSQKALKSTCSQQRIRNAGKYQTFSLLGLLITICVGTAIILTSLFLELCVQWSRSHWSNSKTDYREVARIADHTLQHQRMALLGAGYRDGWDDETLLDNMPVTTSPTLFPLPSRKNLTDQDYEYAVPERHMPMNQIARQPSTQSGPSNGRVSPMSQEHLPANSSQSPSLPSVSGSQQNLDTGSGESSPALGPATPLSQEHLPTNPNPGPALPSTDGSEQHARSGENNRGSA